jgi:hypothetical protein
MTNEELTAAIDSLRIDLITLDTEYQAGVRPIFLIAKDLIASEHYHAAGPVMEKLPILDFGERLSAFRAKLDTVLGQAVAAMNLEEIEEDEEPAEEYNDSGQEEDSSSEDND